MKKIQFGSGFISLRSEFALAKILVFCGFHSGFQSGFFRFASTGWNHHVMFILSRVMAIDRWGGGKEGGDLGLLYGKISMKTNFKIFNHQLGYMVECRGISPRGTRSMYESISGVTKSLIVLIDLKLKEAHLVQDSEEKSLKHSLLETCLHPLSPF